jgi:hypothetical protein
MNGAELANSARKKLYLEFSSGWKSAVFHHFLRKCDLFALVYGENKSLPHIFFIGGGAS